MVVVCAVVSCRLRRPPIIVLIRGPFKSNTSWTYRVPIICFSVIWSRQGCTRWLSLTTLSQYVSYGPSSVVCRLRMLVTFERVWAVGGFDVRCSLFVVPHQPRASTATHQSCFFASRGYFHSQRAKSGERVVLKGVLPYLAEAAG